MADVLSEPWLDFLTKETSILQRLGPAMGTAAVRRALLDLARERFDWPMRTSFRATVVGESRADLSLVNLEGVPDASGEGVQRCLEVVPEGYPESTYWLTGGFVFPCERGLHPGSVVRVTLEVQDPSVFSETPTGLLCRLVSLEALVAVEA